MEDNKNENLPKKDFDIEGSTDLPKEENLNDSFFGADDSAFGSDGIPSAFGGDDIPSAFGGDDIPSAFGDDENLTNEASINDEQTETLLSEQENFPDDEAMINQADLSNDFEMQNNESEFQTQANSDYQNEIDDFLFNDTDNSNPSEYNETLNENQYFENPIEENSALEELESTRPLNHKKTGDTNKKVTVRPVRFQQFGSMNENFAIKKNLDILHDISLHVTVELGRTKSSIREVISYEEGSVIELDKIAGEQVEIYVNDRIVAKGEVIVIEDQFGVRVTSTNIPKNPEEA